MSGVRLLPFVGGLAVGAIPAERIARAVGTRLAVGLGFLVLAGGLLLGTGGPRRGGLWGGPVQD